MTEPSAYSDAGAPPTQQDVLAAAGRIFGTARRTPLVLAEALSERLGKAVELKLETLQPTGSFKIRGAANRLLALEPAQRSRGVVAVSTGNHGRALAYVGRLLNIPVTVCISEMVPINKVESLRAAGAEVLIGGAGQDEATARAEELASERGMTFVHPFDDPHVIAGQGTIGLELQEEMPELDTVLVPLSGGGLVSGIALALKADNPNMRVVAVSAATTPVMLRSLEAGTPVEMPEVLTLADSLGGGIGLQNRYTFGLVRDLVDEHVIVTEAEIAAGMRHLLMEERLVAEGGAAVGVAALLAGRVYPGEETAVVLSGRNVDMQVLIEVARSG